MHRRSQNHRVGLGLRARGTLAPRSPPRLLDARAVREGHPLAACPAKGIPAGLVAAIPPLLRGVFA
eukprot:5283173-Alexandrium_andersonii.AAC.1